MIAELYYGNTHYVKVEGLVNPNAPTVYFDDTATVTATLYNTDGTAVTSGSATLDYVASSNGNFLGDLSHSADIEAGTKYRLRIDVTGPDGNKGRWDVRADCIWRES